MPCDMSTYKCHLTRLSSATINAMWLAPPLEQLPRLIVSIHHKRPPVDEWEFFTQPITPVVIATSLEYCCKFIVTDVTIKSVMSRTSLLQVYCLWHHCYYKFIVWRHYYKFVVSHAIATSMLSLTSLLQVCCLSSHCSKFVVSHVNATSLLSLMSLLQVHCLSRHCYKFFVSHVTVTSFVVSHVTVTSLLSLMSRLQVCCLSRHCYKFVVSDVTVTSLLSLTSLL